MAKYMSTRWINLSLCVLLSPEHSEGESLFYIISPKDIVVAKERDQDDHIDWLLDKKKYEVKVLDGSVLWVCIPSFMTIYCTEEVLTRGHTFEMCEYVSS